MQHNKQDSLRGWYKVIIQRETKVEEDKLKIQQCFLYLDATGLAALIRSLDVATNEGVMARSIGLRRKKKKKGVT